MSLPAYAIAAIVIMGMIGTGVFKVKQWGGGEGGGAVRGGHSGKYAELNNLVIPSGATLNGYNGLGGVIGTQGEASYLYQPNMSSGTRICLAPGGNDVTAAIGTFSRPGGSGAASKLSWNRRRRRCIA